MEFSQKLTPAVLLRRYKRFLADVQLQDGRELTVHCPNSGSMLGCQDSGMPVMLSLSDNVKRKYLHTLEMVRVGTTWVGIHTGRTNNIVREAIEQCRISELKEVDHIQPEVKINEKSRLDFLLTANDKKIYLEVKNCTLASGGVAMFPDAVTVRGTKHLRELAALHQKGHGAIVLFCIQREDAEVFSPAAAIDPVYAAVLEEVWRCGVRVLAYQARVSPLRIEIFRSLPVSFHAPLR